MPPKDTRTLNQKLIDYSDRSRGPESCWIWVRSCDEHGYGFVKWDGRMQKVHRLSWMCANGPIPDGLQVLHNCPGGDNPTCINPRHLWLGTHAQNMKDMYAKGRHRKIRLFGDDNPARKRKERMREDSQRNTYRTKGGCNRSTALSR